MKINYKKVNNVMDFIYTVGLAVCFMIAGIFVNNILYYLVSFSYGIWVISLWVYDLIEKKKTPEEQQKEEETDKEAKITHPNSLHQPVCPT
ncbi:MAG: hypothetical protein GF364_14465 [Candidatus Lokiarchaeota archaeon]|nr:hypothetical protein [Candidatus Lokiarchaeota archaeon]